MKIIRILINITLPIFLFVLVLSILITKPYLMVSKGLYESHENLDFNYDYATERIIGYLNYRYDDLNFGRDSSSIIILLTPDEITHMEDVKTLFTAIRVIGIISLILSTTLISFVYWKDKKQLYDVFKNIYVIPMMMILFIGVFMVIDFNSTFQLMHNILFTNDYWSLTPEHVLIRLLPETFWLISGLILIILYSSILAGVYYFNEKRLKNL